MVTVTMSTNPKFGFSGGTKRDGNFTYLHGMYQEATKGVRHLLVRKSIPNGLVFVGELPSRAKGAFIPKMDHLKTTKLIDLKHSTSPEMDFSMREMATRWRHIRVCLTKLTSLEASLEQLQLLY
ncbi:Mannosyl-oligosaccharide 1,2-alpha-mannosidase MNS3 [Morella rubra]|uniref:Mannosyl-oligosaccharide 1,2-alpha-mannosidase MNS3 n=1 Tax=Morella rubra TaxID=262757 RepID=A0A6A1V7Z4_9ROSI|nr:Mannosyl-oligosaccharide 1,2-alpha-mannosidase MNS3 [Morella rubra]